MMQQITYPLTLEGERVKLVPLEETHFEELITASTDERIWQFLSINGYDRTELLPSLKEALRNRWKGEEYPFVIIDKLTGKIIGCTRFMDIVPEWRKLEIGWTWYIPQYWATGYNNECKLLLLTYAFETLGCIRVQLKTSDKNLRSQAAIQKIGAKYEGLLRNHMIRSNGQLRSTMFFSIIDSEWPEAKVALQQKVDDKLQNKLTA